MKAAILTDLTRCAGCEACALACKEVNQLPTDGETTKLSATNWCAVQQHDGLHVRRQCMHCLDPACAAVCPVGALHKTAEGPVVYDQTRCIGCRYCMIACPFSIPKYEWDHPLPRVRKCIFCFEQRLNEGREPACTAACPTGAIRFGDREELIDEARHRLVDHPDRYVDHLYGIDEAGGTSVLYLSNVPFEALGFPTDLRGEPYPRLTWEILSKIPNVVGIAGVLLFGVWWITSRRQLLDKVRRGEMTIEQASNLKPPFVDLEDGVGTPPGGSNDECSS